MAQPIKDARESPWHKVLAARPAILNPPPLPHDLAERPIAAAVVSGDLSVLEAALDASNATAAHEELLPGSTTPLMLAAAAGRVDMLKVLLEHDAASSSLAHCDSAHTNALTRAVVLGHIDAARFLLEQQADPNIECSALEAALLLGTSSTKDNYNGKRSSEMVHLLLESPSVRFDLWTCSMAIAASMPDALASLLSRNATALLNDLSPAIREQHLDQWLAASAATCSSPEVMLMVFELLRRHRQLDLDHHSTPATTATAPTATTATPPLLSVAQLNSLLGKSIENRQVAVARELLLARADVNQPVPQMRLYLPRHMLPLMKLPFELALEISAFDMLELLLDFNADVTHSLSRAIAAYDRPPTLIPRLIKSNADVNSMAATQGGPPLLYALDEPHLVRFLIDAGADPTMLSSNGKALWEEARVLEVIEMLHNHSTSISSHSIH